MEAVAGVLSIYSIGLWGYVGDWWEGEGGGKRGMEEKGDYLVTKQSTVPVPYC